jgi:23S rRNA pseudouridine1911/1915/1917 synthase
MTVTGETRLFEAAAADRGERLDVFVAGRAPELSRSRVQRLIADGLVSVGGRPVKANYKLQPGEEVSLTVPPPEPVAVEAEAIPLDVLYEDAEVVVVNKPRGMVVHPAAGNWRGTLVNALLARCGDLSGVGGEVRPGIVHRLDKDTSGVMVAAKSDRAHASLAKQIKDRTAGRRYLALVHGSVQADEGLIDAPIGRHRTDRKKMAVDAGHGREARTRFTVLERFNGYTLVKCKLETGRTHQIRVHMAYIGHPVVGDPKYGPRSSPFNIAGQALHSAELSFRHPASGAEMVFTAPLPGDMEEILAKLRKRGEK